LLVGEWPVIIQGALGSALFWAVLELVRFAVKKLAAAGTSIRRNATHDAMQKEYVHLRFTSHSGGQDFLFGHFLVLHIALTYVIAGLCVACLGFFLFSFSRLAAAVCVFNAVVLFLGAVRWLWIKSSYSTHTPEGLRRLAALERELYGNVRPELEREIEALGKPGNPNA
jgi:hypothetical protein